MPFLFFLLSLFSFSSLTAPITPITIDRLEASVNTTLILLSDLQHFRETINLRAQLDPLFSGTPLAAQGLGASNDLILDFIIHEKLIAQQFAVTDSDVELEINSIQANNKINRANLRRALKDQGFTFEDYFELIRSSAAKRSLIDREIRTKVSVSEDDIKNYFYNHFAQKNAPALSYSLKIISVSLKSYTSSPAAKEVALRALGALKSGESFEEVAKRFSDDTSANAGGDLGTLTEEEMSPLIKTQIKKLQMGQISPLLGGPESGSYFILKLMDIQSTESTRFEKMKEEIRGQLAAAEYQHQISLWLERQQQKAFIHKAGQNSSLPVSTP